MKTGTSKLKLGSVLAFLALPLVSTACNRTPSSTPSPAHTAQIQQPFEFMGIKFGQPVGAQRQGLSFTAIAGDPNSGLVSGDSVCGGTSKAGVTYVDGNVAGMLCRFNVTETDSLLKALKAKFGEVQYAQSGTIQNAFGAQASQDTYAWKVGPIRIWLTSPGDKIDNCVLFVQTPENGAATDATRKAKADKYQNEF